MVALAKVAPGTEDVSKWLTASEVSVLAKIEARVARRAIAAGSWRGEELVTRELSETRGRGGKTRIVHIDSLPADLREAWYLSNGQLLNERSDAPSTSTIENTVLDIDRGEAWNRDLELARFKLSILSPALAHKDRTPERASALKAIIGKEVRFPEGETRTLTRRTVYDWVKAYRLHGLHGLMRKPRDDRKKKRVSVVKSWDDFFADRAGEDARDRVAEELTTYIRGLWGAGEPGWRSICDKSTTRLIELSDALCVDAFAALPQGRLGDTMRGKSDPTRFAICNVTRRRAESERDYAIIAVKDRDNAKYQDRIAPTIRRDYSALRPREIVVGDVHPVDVMMRRPDGTEVWPKAISWLDPSTNEIHMTFVLLEPGEGVRREHVAMSFEAMVEEWGLPALLYLDNGSEYKWQEMVSGFTMLSKLVASSGQMKVFDLDADNEVAARVSTSREAVIRSLAYNAKGKPGIEGAFGNLEQVFFSTIKGWTAGDRMNKRTHQKGRMPVAFPGTAEDFLEQAGQALEWYHKRPQYGRLNGKSPNETLLDQINAGWGKTVLSSPEVLALAFSTEETRTPDRGAVHFTPRRGENLRYYADELLGYQRPVTIRVPAYNPDYLFCFDDDELICVARPEHLYHPLDPAGAMERSRRDKYLRRTISEKRKHCALLSLVDETARHVDHLPAAPEAPIAARVDAGVLDRMAKLVAVENEAAADEATKPRKLSGASQWGKRDNPILKSVTFLEDDDG